MAIRWNWLLWDLRWHLLQAWHTPGLILLGWSGPEVFLGFAIIRSPFSFNHSRSWCDRPWCDRSAASFVICWGAPSVDWSIDFYDPATLPSAYCSPYFFSPPPRGGVGGA